VLGVGGLIASFFHLGRPERAWRTAAMWRTSWLSREVIALPLFMALVALYAWGIRSEASWSAWIGGLALLSTLALFVCTAMIYACIRFLQEWASPYTLANFFLMGCASGTMLAVPLAMELAPDLAWNYAVFAVLLTLAALAVRVASLRRNDRIRPKSTTQSAIGVAHPRVQQKSQGFTASSFNTREFFHGASPARMRTVRTAFLLLTFVVPVPMMIAGAKTEWLALACAACAVQYAGLVLERWFFLAQANHPQNLYYQARS
jgi:DMSO reductase anchor subunit